MAFRVDGTVIVDDSAKLTPVAITNQTDGLASDVSSNDELLVYNSETGENMRLTIGELYAGSNISDLLVTNIDSTTVDTNTLTASTSVSTLEVIERSTATLYDDTATGNVNVLAKREYVESGNIDLIAPDNQAALIKFWDINPQNIAFLEGKLILNNSLGDRITASFKANYRQGNNGVRTGPDTVILTDWRGNTIDKLVLLLDDYFQANTGNGFAVTAPFFDGTGSGLSLVVESNITIPVKITFRLHLTEYYYNITPPSP